MKRQALPVWATGFVLNRSTSGSAFTRTNRIGKIVDAGSDVTRCPGVQQTGPNRKRVSAVVRSVLPIGQGDGAFRTASAAGPRSIPRHQNGFMKRTGFRPMR